MRPNGPWYPWPATIFPPRGGSCPACAAATRPAWTPREITRAVIESVAENTSDAVVAPLLWGAVAGLPGLAAYRAVNTLDAMVGYRSPRYLRFGWASARLDDVANWVPGPGHGRAHVVAACAADGPSAGDVRPGSAGRGTSGTRPARAAALRAVLRDGARHPSPNAGRCEAAFAGALGLRLGGTNVYGGVAEVRPELGEGRAPEPDDIRRAVRLSRAVTAAATGLAAASLWFPRSPRLTARRHEESDQPEDQRGDGDPPQHVQRESRAERGRGRLAGAAA